ncbi:MAG: AbrB/MazE/SpoVT family DNA-binding domain-containing protein [Roseitalea sp.]|jgi:AbrB family looped-hinge helix DNA binding protein|nr:AbrB/MazE/SpoVT family DNA-binding domain-containing protein [Roseitalea sp.]MBO6723572.1 AbrB/MazE/SpoVT family DNA-binding domain-containing protein [Roseitalea sp.]MBO6741856.1 AbrB/MazE/SpoVT family DNA-binding domain-containing protein [Roseitalea sp.]
MRVSEKGQVTIPKHVREQAGIKPNSEVVIHLEGGRVVVEPVNQAENHNVRQRMEHFLSELKKLEGTGDPATSADDVMRATRDRD